MRNVCRVCALVLAPFFLAACNSGSSSSAAGGGASATGFDQTKLETCIPEMIRLIEAKDYVTLLKTFSTPEMLKEMTGGKPVEEAAKELEPMFQFMLEGLKKAKDIKPTMENDGNKAVYKVTDKPGQSESIVFTKVNNRWYAGK